MTGMQARDIDLSGRRVVVTGAAGGIGAAAATALCSRGADVVGFFHRTPPGRDDGSRLTFLSCDVTDAEATTDSFAAAADWLGGIDVLVHAAGHWSPSRPEELELDELDAALRVNLHSTVVTNKAAFRHMQADGGQIINFGSGEAVRGNPAAPAYAAAKAGVQAWTRSAAGAWGRYGITVNALAPAVMTPGAERLQESLGPEDSQLLHETLRRAMPLRGELGDPHDDLGPVIAFLASPGARFMTGQLVAVNGGLQMLGA